MSANALFALSAMVATLGVVVVAGGFAGLGGLSEGFGRSSLEKQEIPSSTLIKYACGLGGAVVGFLISGWLVLAAFSAFVGFGAAHSWFAAVEQNRQIERAEAIAAWIESIRDALSAASGVEQAFDHAGRRVADIIREDVVRFTTSRRHLGTDLALRQLTERIELPVVDRFAASIRLASKTGSGRLVESLDEMAVRAREDAALARKINAERSGPQSQANTISVLALFVVYGSILFRREAVMAYSTSGGQIALSVFLGALAGSLFLFYRFGVAQAQIRPLKPADVLEAVELDEGPSWQV